MDLRPFYSWIVLVHVLAAFAFVLAHGVSMFVADRARRETELERIRAMLDLSRYSLPVMYGSLLVLFFAGILAGIVGGHFARLWIWLALAILIAETIAMYALATRYFVRLRTAAGLPVGPRGRETTVPTDPDQLQRLLASRRVDTIAGVGALGLVIIIWLMVIKPF